MLSTTIVKSNAYYDSVTLMKISGQVSKLSGVIDVLVGMGTELNKDSLKNIGLLSEECEKANPNDLMIGINAESEDVIKQALSKIEELFASKGKCSSSDKIKYLERIEEVAELNDGYNLAVISVPGAYAAREARAALNNGMHVFLFSDNVSIVDEVRLKELAYEKGLLMMGPDCGTSIINGIPLGFANRVRRGNIGIVGASGTGLQQVTTLIHALGAGVSQAIGTGGRDLSSKVSGRTMLMALESLKEDSETKVVVIISKPPAPEVAEKVFHKARRLGKKVVMCLLGAEPSTDIGDNVYFSNNLEETALKAVALSLEKEVSLKELESFDAQIKRFEAVRSQEQKYVRGIFCGGTLCDEAMTIFKRENIPFHSNIPISSEIVLDDVNKSEGNTFIDMGDDYFTRGKPHPMIEPGLRNHRIVEDALDPETAVILVDVELGHGSHIDPAGIVAEAALEADKKLKELGKSVLWIASLVGTDQDPQGYYDQINKLKYAGFLVFESNVRAAKLAASIVRG